MISLICNNTLSEQESIINYGDIVMATIGQEIFFNNLSALNTNNYQNFTTSEYDIHLYKNYKIISKKYGFTLNSIMPIASNKKYLSLVKAVKDKDNIMHILNYFQYFFNLSSINNSQENDIVLNTYLKVSIKYDYFEPTLRTFKPFIYYLRKTLDDEQRQKAINHLYENSSTWQTLPKRIIFNNIKEYIKDLNI